LRKTGCLPGGGGEVAIAQAAAAPFAKDELPPMLRQVRNQLAFGRMLRRTVRLRFGRQINFHRAFTAGMADQWASTGAEFQGGRLFALFGLGRDLFGRADGRWQFPDKGAARNFYEEVFSGSAIHAFSQSSFTFLCDEPGLVVLRNQIVQIVIGLQNDTSAAPAVAAARPAFGNIRFSMKRHASLAAMTGAGEDFHFIDKHLDHNGQVTLSIKKARPRTSPGKIV
jgi:hypothetical protein